MNAREGGDTGLAVTRSGINRHVHIETHTHTALGIRTIDYTGRNMG